MARMDECVAQARGTGDARDAGDAVRVYVDYQNCPTVAQNWLQQNGLA
jgi:hypothetical protein